MNKNELRKEALLKRLQYSPEECSQMRHKITNLFFNNSVFDFSHITYLHLFLPIAQKNEINTYPIFERLTHNFPSIHLVLSQCDFTDYSMRHFLFTKDTPLKENKYGIPEPVSGLLINPERLDIVLVPLLVVDEKGHRIGYGKGFYDRFLAQCRPDCLKVGLSFEKPISSIPFDLLDIPLDICITPDKIWEFRNSMIL